ncbi:hypothetical protein NEAUS04_2029 [Nematocida ausubeli]|nr:hypothetical protein NEAUS04_2029 [Nematocida ausubeli]
MNEYIANYKYTKSISCIGESASVSARINENKIVSVAYENILVWNVDTLSIEYALNYSPNSPTAVSAIGAVPGEETRFIIGHVDGVVRCIDQEGSELFGFREHLKKIIGIDSTTEIAVVYSVSAFTVIDLRIESVLCTINISIPIRVVKIVNSQIHIGTEQGIVHTYKITDLFNKLEDPDIITLSGNRILDFLVTSDALYAILPECIVNVETKAELKLNHRITHVATEGEYIFARDTKSKYHWMCITEGNIVEKGQFKSTRPVTSLQVFCNKAVALFADNGISVYRGNDYITSVEGGRDNLIAVVVNSGSVLGITETEGKLFAVAPETDALDTLDIARVLFEDTGMKCISVHNGKYYIGRKDGNISVRNIHGEEMQVINVSEDAIVSLDVKDALIAASTGNRVILLERRANLGLSEKAKKDKSVCAEAYTPEAFEVDELEYEDEVICVRVSQDCALVFASLADSTVKVHKIDGTKVLSLYGHSVPVVDMCICMEKDLLYTLGGDKLVKVWGLRHGECRKTLNPIDPSGIYLQNNLLIVSTGYGLVYYLRETFEKVKQIEYLTGKTRAVPGQNRIAIIDRHMLVTRERAISLFTEGDYSTTLFEERSLAEKAAEIKELTADKKIYRISALEELEVALEEDNSSHIYAALKRLPKTDIEKVIDLMNAEMHEKLVTALSEVPADDNPLVMGWALGRLLQKTQRTDALLTLQQKLRVELRKQARLCMANRAAIQWSIQE